MSLRPRHHHVIAEREKRSSSIVSSSFAVTLINSTGSDDINDIHNPQQRSRHSKDKEVLCGKKEANSTNIANLNYRTFIHTVKPIYLNLKRNERKIFVTQTCLTLKCAGYTFVNLKENDNHVSAVDHLPDNKIREKVSQALRIQDGKSIRLGNGNVHYTEVEQMVEQLQRSNEHMKKFFERESKNSPVSVEDYAVAIDPDGANDESEWLNRLRIPTFSEEVSSRKTSRQINLPPRASSPSMEDYFTDDPDISAFMKKALRKEDHCIL